VLSNQSDRAVSFVDVDARVFVTNSFFQTPLLTTIRAEIL
jgi:hypothetical protein